MTDRLDSRGRIIAGGSPDRQPAEATKSRTGAARYVREDVLAALQPAQRPPPSPLRVRATKARTGFMGLVMTVVMVGSVVQLLASCAPSISHPHEVPAAQFDGACGYQGPARSAVAYAQSGGLTLYHVVCADNGVPVPMEVAR